jgi:hypothetical protein
MMALLFWVFSCKIIVVYALISSPGSISNMVFLHHSEEYKHNLLVCNLSDFESMDFC